MRTTTEWRRESKVSLAARLGLVLAVGLGLLLTLPFAVAFDEAYDAGRAGLLPAGLEEWIRDRGLLGTDTTAVYDRYGLLYLLALGLLTASFVLVARPFATGTRVLVAGMLTLCVGVLLDYGVPNDYVGAFGFMLEQIGFGVIAIGVGLVVRHESGPLAGVAAVLGTLTCMVAGGVLTGHVPSGPGLMLLVGAFVVGLSDGVAQRLRRSGSPGGNPVSPS